MGGNLSAGDGLYYATAKIKQRIGDFLFKLITMQYAFCFSL
jgi:hypothetical protein